MNSLFFFYFPPACGFSELSCGESCLDPGLLFVILCFLAPKHLPGMVLK